MDSGGGLIAAAAFVVNTAVVLIGGGVAYARQEGRMAAMVAKAERSMDEKIAAATKGVEERIDVTIRNFGETVAAIRQKITDVELFMRDNYVHQKSFNHGLDQLSESVKNLGSTIDSRLIRMESKIDDARKSQQDRGGI